MRFPIRRRLALSSGSGQALVELAVMMAFGSIVLIVGFGVVEFGKIIYDGVEVSSAAKAGVEYGAQGTAYASDAVGIQNAAAASAPDLSGLTTTSSVACRCSIDNSSVSCTSVACAGPVKSVVTVNTSVTVTPPLQLRWFPRSSFTLTGSATQECPQ